MSAYYNENDAQKAAWLRELIKANVVAPGEVDERSIEKVEAQDIRKFQQCHFFAGIGVWSYALRLAGWPDDRPVWTGSCPCPSFSAAGKGKGFDDPRHLWPHWSSLIGECRPATIFGEQVDDAIGHGWLDLVYVDLEKAAYSVGAAVLGACSVGAPHIRQRLYFGAHAQDAEIRSRHGEVRARTGAEITDRSGNGLLSRRSSDSDVRLPSHGNLQRSGEQRLLAEDGGTGERLQSNESGLFSWREASTPLGYGNPADTASGASDGSDSPQRGQPMHGSAPGNGGHAAQPDQPLFGSQPLRDWRGPGWLDPHTARSVAEAGATRGFWADCDWWHARDEKYRPIGHGISPLIAGTIKSRILAMASGIAADIRLVRDLGDAEPESAEARVLRLRGYGDAICAPLAAEFIAANMEILDAKQIAKRGKLEEAANVGISWGSGGAKKVSGAGAGPSPGG